MFCKYKNELYKVIKENDECLLWNKNKMFVIDSKDIKDIYDVKFIARKDNQYMTVVGYYYDKSKILTIICNCYNKDFAQQNTSKEIERGVYEVSFDFDNVKTIEFAMSYSDGNKSSKILNKNEFIEYWDKYNANNFVMKQQNTIKIRCIFCKKTFYYDESKLPIEVNKYEAKCPHCGSLLMMKKTVMMK